jgi:hypothetical protein
MANPHLAEVRSSTLMFRADGTFGLTTVRLDGGTRSSQGTWSYVRANGADVTVSMGAQQMKPRVFRFFTDDQFGFFSPGAGPPNQATIHNRRR